MREAEQGKGNMVINLETSDPIGEAQGDKIANCKISPILMLGDCLLLLYPYASESHPRRVLTGVGYCVASQGGGSL